ncbi:A24 family peptidase [Azonexus sp.]|uniref:A24 family peptidase n=1 Tax=Azonexus sp. TaxID=1872668 RepID=UPI0039E4099B
MALQLVLTVWALILAVSDARCRKLPNAWLLAGIAVGLVFFVARGSLPFGQGVFEAVLVLVLVLLCFIPFYLAGWMGAGDVKYMAVIGWLGGGEVFFAVFLIGSIIAGLAAVMIQGWPQLWRQLLGSAALDERLSLRIPFGSCLSLALLAVLWLGVPGWLHLLKERLL